MLIVMFPSTMAGGWVLSQVAIHVSHKRREGASRQLLLENSALPARSGFGIRASMSEPPPKFPPPLYKQRSLSSDTFRDEAWLRRRNNSKKQRSKSVTDDDLDELKACMELGFGFDSPDLDRKLSDTFPALELYHAVNKQYKNPLSSSSSVASDCDPCSPVGSPNSIFDTGNNSPQLVKARLKQWAQLVACSVRHSSPS